MQKIYFIAVLVLLATWHIDAKAQTLTPQFTNFYDSIKRYDLSRLWSSDSILVEESQGKVPFPEPIGYIGVNFERFYIHYTSVVKDKSNPYAYHVAGKTRVQNNICSFTGIITIVEASLDAETMNPKYKEGSVSCTVHFYEDSADKGSGTIEGELTTGFCLDRKNNIYYDALLFGVADGFSNNQSETTWTSYKTGIKKKCNWGDYRIPDSKGLDIGAGVFYVREEYLKFGWETYRKAYAGTDTPESKKALSLEKRKWW